MKTKPQAKLITQDTDDGKEILIYGPIGESFWSDEGISATKFVEALNDIPQGTKITIGINSQGGAVGDGLTLFNAIARRKKDITARIDGYALSAGSFIPLAAGKVLAPKSSIWMIHKAWSFAAGNADEMRKSADMLDAHDSTLLNIYVAKTGKSSEEVLSDLSEEKWMTGEEAVDYGLADEQTDYDLAEDAFACVDLSPAIDGREDCPQFINQKGLFARLAKAMPKSVTKLFPCQPSQNVHFNKKTTADSRKQPDDAMNRKNILQLLERHEIEADDKMSNDQLFDLLEKLPFDAREDREQAQDWLIEHTEVERKKVVAKSDGDPSNLTAQISTLTSQVSSLTAQNERERKGRISKEIDQLVIDDKIDANERGRWLDRCLKDESILDDLQAREPNLPGAKPIKIDITGESPSDLAKNLAKFQLPIKSLLRGNRVTMQEISLNAKALSTAINDESNRKRLNAVLAANTIDADLKRNVIMNDIMRAYKRKLVLLNVFATTFRNVPLEGTDKLVIPFYDNDTSAVKTFTQGTGYEFDEDTDTSTKEITIDKRKYKSMDFSSEEFRRQPYFQPSINMMLKMEQLALQVWLDILSVVTYANFGAEVHDEDPENFDSDDVATLVKDADDADWPDTGRTLVLGTIHKRNLLQDDDLKRASYSGTVDTLREGSVGNIYGFETFFSPRIPTNNEALRGFINLPQAILVGTAPIMPAPGVRNDLVNYDLVVDPDLGFALEYKMWGSATQDVQYEVIEANYGYAIGITDALKRIVYGTS